MGPSPSYYAPAGKKKGKKRLIFGILIILVVLLFIAYKQKGYISGGFAVRNITDGAKIPTPCGLNDHLRIDSATYTVDAGNVATDVVKTLQAAYNAQAGSAPYTVNSVVLLNSVVPKEGSLTFKARCPQGRVK